MSRSWLCVTACVLMVASPSIGTSQTATTAGSIERGARIAALGNGKDATACASCHAFDGNADPSGAFPRLAGQSDAYMLHALDQFASKRRESPIMTPLAKALEENQRRDVVAYYASLRSPVPPAAEMPPAVLEKGRILATVGSNDEQIPACTACHGPFGRSATAPIPSLSGQYAAYIVGELKAFRSGHRGPKLKTMDAIAHAVTEDEMVAVGAYFQRQQRPPTSPLPPVSAR